VRLKHLNPAGHFPSGNERLYYRPKGQKGIPMPDYPRDHPKFLAAYAAAAGLSQAPMPSARSGTIGAGVGAFLVSAEYLSKSPGVKAHWRTALDRIRKSYGHCMMADLRAEHIAKDLEKMNPHPANNRLKVWRALCGWWQEQFMVKVNAAAAVKRRKVPKTDGFSDWTESDLEAFRAYWPLHSAERMAFELLHWTGARMSDAIKLTEGMIGNEVTLPFRANAPEFSEPEGQAMMLEALDARPSRHAVIIVTSYGKPRSVKAASAWFAAAARAAGVKGKSAHGLRKRRAGLMASNGASTSQIAAWLGHESLKMVEVYTRKADRKRMLSGTGGEQKSSNFPAEVPKQAKK
jgi:integrase